MERARIKKNTTRTQGHHLKQILGRIQHFYGNSIYHSLFPILKIPLLQVLDPWWDHLRPYLREFYSSNNDKYTNYEHFFSIDVIRCV